MGLKHDTTDVLLYIRTFKGWVMGSKFVKMDLIFGEFGHGLVC